MMPSRRVEWDGGRWRWSVGRVRISWIKLWRAQKRENVKQQVKDFKMWRNKFYFLVPLRSKQDEVERWNVRVFKTWKFSSARRPPWLFLSWASDCARLESWERGVRRKLQITFISLQEGRECSAQKTWFSLMTWINHAEVDTKKSAIKIRSILLDCSEGGARGGMANEFCRRATKIDWIIQYRKVTFGVNWMRFHRCQPFRYIIEVSLLDFIT